MTSVAAIETQVNKHIECCKHTRRIRTNNLSKDTVIESGYPDCAPTQLFRSSFDITKLSYNEICNLSWLLTKELKIEINRDHFFLWSWSAWIASYFRSLFFRYSPNIDSIFHDADWIESFLAMINSLLIRHKNIPPKGLYPLVSCLSNNRYLLAGPISYSVLEGLLRRKNSNYMDRDGIILGNLSNLSITTTYRGTEQLHANKRSNNIYQSLAIFEQHTIPYNRNDRPCIGLDLLKQETLNLYPHLYADFYSFIDEGRNTLIHSRKYWQNKVPILMNLICLLLIDCIEPSLYDNNIAELNTYLDFYKSRLQNVPTQYVALMLEDIVKKGIFYPPDMDL
jgi:hypothetical protein